MTSGDRVPGTVFIGFGAWLLLVGCAPSCVPGVDASNSSRAAAPSSTLHGSARRANDDALPSAGPRAARRAEASLPTTPVRAALPNAPVEPRAYDLAGDIAERTADLSLLLGAAPETSVVRNVFLVATPKRGGLPQSLGIVEQALDAYFNQRFARAPERVVSVLLYPTTAGYHGYCRARSETECDSPYGFYEPGARRIVVNMELGIGTLTHELVHPIVEADFPEAPDWLNEGIASLYERFYFPKRGEIRGAKNWRHPALLAAFADPNKRAQARLSSLFGMSDETFRGDDEALNYALARYVCQWLDAQHKLWPFYQRYRDQYRSDPSGRAAFTEVLGATPEALESDWQRWVRRL